ncbi:MAG: hypothetical protein ABIP39_15710, partial [Polyangiaceae bacterium]
MKTFHRALISGASVAGAAFVISCSAILGLTDPSVDENAAAGDAAADTLTAGDALLTNDGPTGDGGEGGTCGDPMKSVTDCG